MKSIAYKLFWDTSHLPGEVLDAELKRFDGWSRCAGWHSTRDMEIPPEIHFEANFSITRKSDYPSNDVVWSLMSPEMIAVLTSVGDFSHRTIPVRFLDRSVHDADRYLPDGTVRPEVVDDRFAVVQLLEHVDVVDWERSEFRRSRIDPESVARFSRLVLVEPPGGLPPLFRIPAKTSMLFVSVAAREALEAAGLRGMVFEDLPDGRRFIHD